MVTLGASKDPVKAEPAKKRNEEIIFSEDKPSEERKPRKYDRPKKRED